MEDPSLKYEGDWRSGLVWTRKIMREIPGLGIVLSIFEPIALYHSSYLFFLPTDDQQAVENAEKIPECVERRENWWIQPFGGWSLQQCVAVSFGKGGILDGMKVEEKLFEGEVFSNCSDDTKLENHVQSFPSDQCWFSLQ